MKSDLAQDAPVSATETGANCPEIKWGSLFPQIYTRKGTIRKPKKYLRSDDKTSRVLKKYASITSAYQSNVFNNPSLRIITDGGGVWMEQSVLECFLQKEDDGLLDLLSEGWIVNLV